MPNICPQCGLENPEYVRFCTRCGALVGSPPAAAGDTTSNVSRPLAASAPIPAVPATASPPQQPVQVQNQIPFPPTPGYPGPQPPPVTPVGPPPTYLSPQAQAGDPGYVFQPPPQPLPQPGYMPQQPASRPGTSQGLDVLQGAFAGNGMPVAHRAWLIDEQDAQPALFQSTLLDVLRQQGLAATSERLKEGGSAVPARDYVAVHQGKATTFLYTSAIGRDLYISRTTTFHTPLSYIRVALVLLIFVAMLISFGIFNAISIYHADTPDSLVTATTTRMIFTFTGYALLFLLLILLVRCVVQLLTEKDFLRPLRAGHLSDFQLDDLATLDYTTDRAVQTTLQQLKLRTSTEPLSAYRPRQRLQIL